MSAVIAPEHSSRFEPPRTTRPQHALTHACVCRIVTGGSVGFPTLSNGFLAGFNTRGLSAEGPHADAEVVAIS